MTSTIIAVVIASSLFLFLVDWLVVRFLIPVQARRILARIKSEGTKPSKTKFMREAKFIVRIENNEIINERPEGKIERVSLSGLKAVIIETNDTGPWGTDVLWILVGADETGCVFPNGATGGMEILEIMQKLPGFDNKAVIQAMASISNQRFLCWKSDS
jgi:hypothetical protein